MEPKYNFQEIVKSFQYQGNFIKAEPYGFGHINNTYAVYFKNPEETIHRYILQRINTGIFKAPENLMENIENVTEHIKGKLRDKGGNPERETLTIVKTKDGNSFHKSENGDYWRSYLFIEEAQTYQLVENPSHFYNAGKAFGRFGQYLADYPAESLYETIPDFHNTRKRYEDFLEAVRRDAKGRVKEVQKEIQFIMERADDTEVLVSLLEAGALSLRVTHNDTKFNNVMIDDATGEGICVIDLDTVMPGLLLYDFGDAIRSGATTAREDEEDLSEVWLDLTLFESFTKGFIETAGEAMTETELEYLPFSARLMTLECGMRFLGDYLNGDIYFKISREKHNLDRARNQLKLTADMEKKFELMKEIVNHSKGR
ncbi:aminoglycoside phosphotransferase family protein [Clostridium sp. KNHs205]|jgi:Ser/Thr protein kinase RdoA (MazF antagonist)|uniref:phosphotransferase enzyme family protein n=1 Tax=Clostridium sp. KNHs205 TaxID=1449050 RepID=UPI00051C199B|nr:aminoglycoside phosphotransferase family protein [Clostridium sp. KNHs205]